MNLEMSTGRKILFFIALVMTNIIFLADTAIVPIIPQFYTDFGDKIGLVNFVVSGPMLVMVIGAFVTSKLLQVMTKRTLLIIGAALFAISANLYIVYYNIYFLAAMRIIYGFAYGMVTVAAFALINQVYEGEKSRANMMGVYGAFAGIFGITLSLIGGQLATINWRLPFQIYWVGILILLLLIVSVPKTDIDPVPERSASAKKEKMNAKNLVALTVAFFVFNVVYCIVYFQIGLYVAENNIGDPSMTGILSAVGTAATCITSLLFGVIYAKMKRATIISNYLALAFGYLILVISPNLLGAVIGCILIGASYGSGLAYYFMRPTVIVPPVRIGLAIACITAANGLGGFASTYVATALQGVMNVSTLTGIMPVLSGMCFVGVALSIILSIRNKKHPSEYQANEIAQ